MKCETRPAPPCLGVLWLYSLLLLVGLSGQAQALYEWESETGHGDVRGSLRGFGVAYKNPEDQFFYAKESGAGLAGIARLIVQGERAERFAFEVNAYQTYIPASLSAQGGYGTVLDVERSAALEWSFSDSDFVRFAFDRLNVRLSVKRLDLTVGRQPINLATTFYFTPNDFFAPFAAQAFYRVFKSGVDAARAEISLGELTQLSLVSALGYSREPGSDTGWSESPDRDRLSNVFRLSTVYGDLEWGVLGGQVRDKDVIGGAIQGELFDWLGIRAEGHWAEPDDPRTEAFAEVSLGLEHRWVNTLTLRIEQYYNGSGANDVDNYASVTSSTRQESLYLARRYTAFGGSYEFTPLLNGEAVAIVNWVDHSWLFSFNGVYSLSDEAELAVNVNVPFGDEPRGDTIRSEFGFYPYTVNVEVRAYF